MRVRIVLLSFAALAALAGCGSSSKRTQSGHASSVVGGVSAQSLQRALLKGDAPRPTAAACRASTPAERAKAPFGHTRLPLFTCELTITGQQAAYFVQVLPNGCFVAERRRPGAAVYGCGVKRS